MRDRGQLLAFRGSSIDQSEEIRPIADGFTCWNLRQLGYERFLDALKSAIPPVNSNVLGHYGVARSGDAFGIEKQDFNRCSWALYLPGVLDGSAMGAISEAKFLLNLFSPVFVEPAFAASDFGILRLDVSREADALAFHHDQSKPFREKQFVSFFRLLVQQSQYGAWERSRAASWDHEDWRLFTSSLLYLGLREYDGAKSAFGWQREAADMATLLEALFTAHDSHRNQIGKRLRDRAAILLGHRVPSIADEIRDLYSRRSDFVHGSFFMQMANDAKAADGIPMPDFRFLYTMKERVRFAFVAYLHLAQKVRVGKAPYLAGSKVLNVLEDATTDSMLAQAIRGDVDKVLGMLPNLVP